MKRLLLKTMLLLCALIVGSSSLWADTAEFAPSDFSGQGTSGSGGNISATVKGVTFSCNKGYGTTQIRCYSGGKITISSENTISAIAFTFSGSYNGGMENSYTDLSTTSWEKTLSSQARIMSVTVTYSAASGTTTAPTITGSTAFLNSTTVTISNASTADGASIYYTLNGEDPTTTTSSTCYEYSAPFTINETTTVKAIAKKSTDSNASSVVSKTFTKINPMTVAQALTAIDALNNNGTIDNQYVSGIIVSKVGTIDDGGIKYYISDDGTATNQLYVYKGKGLDNASFTSLDELQVGDEVVVFGQLKKYYSSNTVTPEVLNSYLISQTHKTAPSFALDITEKTLDAYTHETVDVTLTTNTDGVVSCESSNTDVATVAPKSAGVYTITAQSAGTATITIKSAVSANYAPASATVAVTVTDNRTEAGISFDETAVAKIWGDAFTGQALINPHSLDVTYSSTDETVATVSSTGEVEILKAGSTTIKATFAGNATYKAAVASYTLTVAKAEPNLSFSQTAFDVLIGDNSFVAPTLNNPNNLPVNYSSNNTNVAVVDENTGEILLETSVVGSATITAYFEGNDNFKGGNAKYTVNICDPTVKGSKYNPYTVAEVIDGTATGNEIYVVGYIVGNYNATAPVNPATGDTNIALADALTETSGANTIPVELPTTAGVRANWGPQTNNVIGQKVRLKGNAQTYFSKNGIKGTKEITALSVPVSVTSIGLATFASNNKLDFTNVENLEAYIAKENGDKVELTKVNKVAAGTGVLLRAKNDATTFEVPVTTDDADDATGNLFVRGTGAAVATTDATYTNYILSTKGGVPGFYHANGNTVAKNRAYLHTSVAAARIDLNFDNATGINEVKSEKTVEGIFDLQGRKVITPSKGLYIVNGKKVVIK